MSSWIKIEKALVTDPRFMRFVKGVRNALVTQGRCDANLAERVALGCLVTFWHYADTHLRDDDTLDLGADEIDELIGVEGFTQLMPADWLEVIDPHRVKLPGFHVHNGTEAKKKALTSKRVARHRIRSVTQESSSSVSVCNAGALPDRDQTETRPDHKGERERARADANVPRGTSEPELSSWEWTQQRLRPKYPTDVYTDQDWLVASKEIDAIFETRPEMTRPRLLELTEAFGKQQAALGNTGTKFVQNPVKHFHHIHGKWSGPFAIAAPQAAAPRKSTSTADRIAFVPEN